MNRFLMMSTFAALTCYAYPAAAEQSAADRADALFQQGVERFRERDFAGALGQFQASYEVSPTPALRYNLGVCHYNLGQWEEARRELTAYLADTDPSLITAERRDQVEGMLTELDGRLGPAPTPPDTGPPPSSETPEAPPEPVTAADPREQPVTTPAEPEGNRRRISPGWFWATAGLAVALAIGGAVTGGLELRQESDFDALVGDCNSGARQGCYEDGVVLRDRAEALATATNVLFATAGAAAIAALVLAFFTEWGGGESGSTVAVHISPNGVGAASGLGLDLTLRF